MKKVYFGLTLILGVIFCILPIFAQNITKQSYQQARKVLDESVAAYGGIEMIRSIQNFSIRSQGDLVHRNQSRRADGADREPLRYDYTADIKNDRYHQTFKTKFPGAVALDLRRVFDSKELFVEDLMRKNRTKLPAPPAGRNRISWLPQFSLLEAYERAHCLRYLDTANFNNRPHHVISYTSKVGQQTSLYIDSETKLLSKMEWLVSDPIVGDAINEIIYPSHQTADNFKVPTGRIIKVDNEVTQEVRYTDVSINGQLTDEEFKLNPDFKLAAPPKAKPSQITQVAENVYTISINDLTVLFIGFKDYIWVMEAPGGDAGSHEAIANIRETIPGKPIKYLALTHHHYDHVEGARTYVAEGVTLVTTKGNREYFERNVRSSFTIAPDTLARNPQPLKLELLEGEKRVFTDGTQTVEIYNIGPSPHADEMLVAYLPKEKILYEADILDRPLNGDYPIAEESAVHLARWIERKRLLVEKIIPVHGTVTTMDELLMAVAEREKRKSN